MKNAELPLATPCRHSGRRDGNGRSQKFNGHSLTVGRLPLVGAVTHTGCLMSGCFRVKQMRGV